MSAHTLLCLQELHQREFNQWEINVFIRTWVRQHLRDSWANSVVSGEGQWFWDCCKGKKKTHRDYSGSTWKVLEVQITIHHLYGASHHLRYEVII